MLNDSKSTFSQPLIIHDHYDVSIDVEATFQLLYMNNPSQQLQIEAFSRFLTRSGLGTQADEHSFRLLLIGGCRDDGDLARVAQLRYLVHSRNLQDVIQFHINVSYSSLKRLFHQCMINLHTMVDEHFGIGRSAYLFFSCRVLLVENFLTLLFSSR